MARAAVLALAFLTGAGATEAGHVAAAQGITPTVLVVSRVVDGDTFDANGDRYRIADFDTPETTKRRAKCDAEITLGKKAGAQLGVILKGGVVTATPQGAKWTRDRYGRLLANVSVNGRDVRDAMLSAGFGALWRYGKEPQPRWC